MPADPGHRCAYLRAWVDVKERWALAQGPDERAFIDDGLAACGEGRTPPAP
jgi:hypothetical protein